MDSMPRATANGIDLEYETFGDPGASPLLLIAGLGTQLLSWDEEWCRLLVSRGFYVIRFDNRDVGLSTRMELTGLPDLSDVMSGAVPPPYLLTDMASDVAGLIDALGLPAVHVAGASMGGYIAQLLTLEHPDRVLSLTAMISGPAPREAFPATPEGVAVLLTPPPATREARIAQGVEIRRALVGSADPIDEEVEWRRSQRAVDRAFFPAGAARQLMATLSAEPWLGRLSAVDVPALIVGGVEDILVPVENARAIAAAIPGARLIEIDGMGHDLPKRGWSQIADAIAELSARRSPTAC
jgi:pimeloyl-ACP methyl ester carboxylesterase